MFLGDNLFSGFDPSLPPDRWFERHRRAALLLALLAHLLLGGVVAYLEIYADRETSEEVLLDEPEIENFEAEEELDVQEEEEPEPEPEPEPPKPQQEIRNVDEQTSEISETDVAPQR